MSDTLVLFDFDETLIKENSIKKLLYGASERRFLWPLAIPALVDISAWKQLRLSVKNRVYNACLHSLTDARQYSFGKAFGITFTLNSEVCDKMRQYHQQGHTIWVVSASPQPYIEGVIEVLGLPCELVIGTQVPSPCVTFNLSEVECAGEKKVSEVRKLLLRRKLQFNTILAYGNLPHDREMLSMAHEGYVVTNGKISKYSTEQ